MGGRELVRESLDGGPGEGHKHLAALGGGSRSQDAEKETKRGKTRKEKFRRQRKSRLGKASKVLKDRGTLSLRRKKPSDLKSASESSRTFCLPRRLRQGRRGQPVNGGDFSRTGGKVRG